MPNVRIAWYSEAELRRYHVCGNCNRSRTIYRSHLVTGTERDIIDILREQNPNTSRAELLCDSCEDLLRSRTGDTFTIPVAGG